MVPTGTGSFGPSSRMPRQSALRNLFFGAMAFVQWVAHSIGWVSLRVILGILFFGVLTPLAVVCRAMGRDVLDLKRSPDKHTYWRPKPGVSSESYFKQF
jgi:hypothetical protein